MSSIVVAPLAEIDRAAERYAPRTMLTLMSTDDPVPAPPGVERHVSLTFNDVADVSAAARGLVPPAREHVQTILDTVRAWDGEAPLLIHCWFGVSRSPAAAILALAALAPERDADEIADALRTAAPYATPNARMIALGDELLDRRGALVRAVERIGRGAETGGGEVFALRA